MGRYVESTQERITRTISEGLEADTSARHNREIDVLSMTSNAPNMFDDPQFNIRLQDTPETRGIPIIRLRANIDIAIRHIGGDSAFEQDIKITRVTDEIIEWFDRKGSRELNARDVRMINSDRSIRRELFVRLVQIEMIVFQRQGEYKIK